LTSVITFKNIKISQTNFNNNKNFLVHNEWIIKLFVYHKVITLAIIVNKNKHLVQIYLIYLFSL